MPLLYHFLFLLLFYYYFYRFEIWLPPRDLSIARLLVYNLYFYLKFDPVEKLRHCKTHIRGSGQDVAKAFGAHSATGNAANPVQPVPSHWVRHNTSLTYCGTVFGIVHLPEV